MRNQNAIYIIQFHLNLYKDLFLFALRLTHVVSGAHTSTSTSTRPVATIEVLSKVRLIPNTRLNVDALHHTVTIV